MTDLRDKIAAVQRKHLLVHYEGRAWRCQCGDDCLTVEGSHSQHVADAVITALKSTLSSEYHKGYLDGVDEGWCQGWEAASGSLTPSPR